MVRTLLLLQFSLIREGKRLDTMPFKKNILFLSFPLMGCGILLSRFLPTGGLLGHDYSHYFSRLLIGADHFLKNGFKVPYYTPYLCGGIPFHADPQQIFFSLPQFLAFLMEILPATYISFAVFYTLGYWGMWKLSHRIFIFSNAISHL